MPTPPLTREQCQAAIDAVARQFPKGFKVDGLPSAWRQAAKELGFADDTIRHRVAVGREKFGLVLPAPGAAEPEAGTGEVTNLRAILSRPRTAAQIMQETGASLGAVLDAIDALAAQGVNIHRRGDLFEVLKDVQLSSVAREPLRYFSRPDNTFVFGAVGDQHIGSKYHREDVSEKLYDAFAAQEVDRVFNTGNWIDGDARFNRFDVEAHGLEAQCKLLADRFPRRDGLTTYAIWGDDHEGWYAQREGVDVGRYAESVMRAEGRADWVDIGFMEAHVELINSNTGAKAIMAVVHPGGGSAYALSYSIQKIVECVPLDTEILTAHGWRRHDEVEPGEVVLGYNVETDRCEWTVVTKKHYGRGEVVSYSNDQFEARCTPNHRWAMEWESRAGPNPNSKEPQQYSRRDRLVQTIDQSRPRSRIIQAAPAPDGVGLQNFVHGDWLQRNGSAIERVLQMTSGERRAFIEGLLLGEGTIGGATDRGYRTVIFSQNPGPVNDAFRLACFLEGIATTDRPTPSGKLKPGQDHRRVVMLQKRMRICDKLVQQPLGEQDVWCVTTGLGTWVMRQGTTITITGNSYEGGEKPHIGLYGHYHKLWAGLIRNVWVAQTGCVQDQTVFMRKKRLEAHVGGVLIRAEQDPESGAIVGFEPRMYRYFNRDWYVKDGQANGRWSYTGDVRRVPRDAEAIRG